MIVINIKKKINYRTFMIRREIIFYQWDIIFSHDRQHNIIMTQDETNNALTALRNKIESVRT